MTPIDDETLNQTLAHLTTAPIPDGLEQRILARLATHAADRPATLGSPSRPATPWLQRPLLASLRRLIAMPAPRPALFASMVFASIALVTLGVRHVTTPPSPPALPDTGLYAAPLQATPVHPALTLMPPSRSAGSPVAQNSTRPPRSLDKPQPTVVSTDEALALAELHAPSQLAPPLPLTDDERALQHLAQHSTPSTVEALNADHRATEEATEQAAFTAFFTPPTFTEKQLRGESE